MPDLVTVVALALAAFLLRALRTCRGHGLPRAPVFQALRLLADNIDEGVGVYGSGGVDDAPGREEQGRELCELFGEAAEYHALIIVVGDGDSGGGKLLVFVSEAGEEGADVCPLCATHLEEALLEIVLSMNAFGCVLLADLLPAPLRRVEVAQAERSRIGKALRQEVPSEDVLVVPLFHRLRLVICGLVCNF